MLKDPIKSRQHALAALVALLILGVGVGLWWAMSATVPVMSSSSATSGMVTGTSRTDPQALWRHRMNDELMLTQKRLEAMETLLKTLVSMNTLILGVGFFKVSFPLGSQIRQKIFQRHPFAFHFPFNPLSQRSPFQPFRGHQQNLPHSEKINRGLRIQIHFFPYVLGNGDLSPDSYPRGPGNGSKSFPKISYFSPYS